MGKHYNHFSSTMAKTTPNHGISFAVLFGKRPVLIKAIIGLSIGFILFLTGCSINDSNPVSSVPNFDPFDTVFSVNSSITLNCEILNRSIVSRGNLSRLITFLKKARNANSLKIGCIGGSITIGTGASSENTRYINRFQYFLQRLFPQTAFSIIDAGIGATNSRFGCSRVREDLLNEKPDLIVIEYAVNDDPNDSNLTTQSIEGLVRQCLQLDSVPVFMLFTMDNKGDTINAHFHSIIGNYYSLPIISYRNAIWPLVETNQLSWTSIAADDVHPNDNGHMIIGYLLYSYVKNVFEQMDTIQTGPVQIPGPFSTDLYEFAGLHSSLPNDPLKVGQNVGWAVVEKEDKRIGYSSTSSGDSIVFKTTLNEVTIGYHYWKNLSGHIQVKLDGQIIDTLSNYFAADWGPGFLRLFQVFKQASNSPHTVTITNINNSLFDMQYLLYAK